MDETSSISVSKNEPNSKHFNSKVQYHELDTIIALLKTLKSDELDLPKSNKDNIGKAVITLKINDILKLNNSSEQHFLLGLDTFKNVNLSDIEKETIREFLEKRINEKCVPVVGFMENFSGNSLHNLQYTHVKQQQLLEMDQKRRDLIVKLSELKNKKCNLLKECVEKAGCEKYNVDMLNIKYKKAEEKTNMLRNSIHKDIVHSTDYAGKAIKEVEAQIDLKLMQKQN